MPTPRRISGEEVARNKKKQQILRQAGYNVKVDGNWGEWQDRKYKEVMAKRTRRNNANVGVLALPAAAALGSTVGSTISAGAVGSALASAAMAAPVALTLLGPAFSLADRIKGTVRTMPRTNKPGVETVDATRVSRPIVVTTPASNVEQAMLRQLARKKAARTKTKTKTKTASQAAPINPQQDQEENNQQNNNQQNNQQNNNQQQQNNQQNNSQQQGNSQQGQSNSTQGQQNNPQENKGLKDRLMNWAQTTVPKNLKRIAWETKDNNLFGPKHYKMRNFGRVVIGASPVAGPAIDSALYPAKSWGNAIFDRIGLTSAPKTRADSIKEETEEIKAQAYQDFVLDSIRRARKNVQQNKEVQDSSFAQPNQNSQAPVIGDYVFLPEPPNSTK